AIDRREADVADRAGPLLDQINPQVVHAFGVRVAVPALLRSRHGVKVIIEPGATPAQRLRDALPDTPPARLEDLVALEDNTLQRADAVIARSAVEAATLNRRGVRPERIWTVPDGLPVSGLEQPVPDLPQLALITGHHADDAVATTLRALSRVARPWRLTIIGPADWSTGAAEARARALKVMHRVAFARLDELAEARILGAQVVISALPRGRAVEAGGIVPEGALWAVACGRPLVAPNLPAVRVYAGGAAHYYDPDDPGALATAIVAVLDDANLRASLAERAAEQRFALSWDAADAMVADLWATLAAASGV
ncbi:MAG: glycosyltransferase, partial [Myxococcales bacterium]|nr:glycosyltransferase [Myxococcales bacterium]